MFFIISKLLSIFLHPFSWIVILLIAAMIVKNSKTKNKLLLITLLTAYFFSNAFIFHGINQLWEYPPTKMENLKENYDAAIVLGGMISYDEGSEMVSFQENIDRLLLTLPMYDNGRIDKILFSGGSGSLVDDELESEVAKQWLLDIGIPKKDILIENKSRNTHENAVYSTELLNELYPNGHFLLFTSAIHMRRSKACFEKTGLEVDVYPVDFISSEKEYHFDDLFLPQTHILGNWRQLLHEWVGYLVYKVKGFC